jgi:N-methylhydantoinase B
MMDPIELEVLWGSLVNTVNEQARALQRAAFSPIVREAGDLANALFDRQGHMVAQAVTGTPGHINSLANGARNILAEYPPGELEHGDVIITNDPYKTAGQLLDVTVLSPVWREGRVIAFFGSTIHHTDVGGYGIGAGARDVFEEGLWIPISKLLVEGERNHDVWNFILSNVREPEHVAGDLHAQVASAQIGAARLSALCDAHGLADIDALSDEIRRRSEEATRKSIRALPAGTYEGRSVLDLADGSEIVIQVAVTVDPDAGSILVDYEGSSSTSPYGINVVKNYTHAYTTFTIRSVLNPEVPNNSGSLAPIEVTAPEGSIVNAELPAPCTARHVVGMFLPMPLLAALGQILPSAVIAEGAAAVWTMQCHGTYRDGRPFVTSMFTYAGGVGARATKDGLSATAYPTGVAAVPIEVIESMAPIRFLRKELRRGSGGAGRHVGGLGQVIEFTVDAGNRWLLNAVTSRLKHPPLGFFGGGPGATGRFLVNGSPVRTQQKLELEPGDLIRLELPGGGGYGEPVHETVGSEP